jgi:ribonucleoside-triphosphate reductase
VESIPKWGPQGQLVYERTYSRTKPDGTKETWRETVERVVDGNLALVPEKYHLKGEREALIDHIYNFKILPGGRHLWASGVKGRQYLFNCHVSGWNNKITDHFEFSFLRLMEGGGVGANYSNSFLEKYPEVERRLKVHVVCDPEHPDYEKMKNAGVLSEVFDSDWEGAFPVEDSREGWACALVDLLDTYYLEDVKHQNRVFDVSRVRGEGSRLKTFGGRASGPLPLAIMLREVSEVMNSHYGDRLSGIGAMEIDHAIAQCVVSGGNRRSARMAMMHWNDWQINEFLECKREGGHWTTNISVVVDDEFWAWNTSDPDLADNWAEYERACNVLHKIAKGMLHNGEPGFWNHSKSQEGEPNEVICTNPCGEITLEAWENCNLGHVNLDMFVKNHQAQWSIDLAGPHNNHWGWDYKGLYEAHRLMTRFLIRATYGDVNDEKQAAILARNRRIGVGHLGFASAVAKLGIKYSECTSDTRVTSMLEAMSWEVDGAAQSYAHQLRIPVPVKTRTVAPTGTIAKLPGVTEGIHPVFAKYFIRRIRFSIVDPDQWATCMDYANRGFLVEPDAVAAETMVVSIPTKDILLDEVAAIWGPEEAEELVQSPAELTLKDMLNVQAMYQDLWADNAVSYTANVDPSKYSVGELTQLLIEYGPELKGGTIFPEQSFPQAPYERLTKEEFEAFEVTETNDSVDENCATGACPVR